MFHWNRPYRLDVDGYLRPTAGQQAAQIEAEASAEEALSDEMVELRSRRRSRRLCRRHAPTTRKTWKG